jgi:hypothetical protein
MANKKKWLKVKLSITFSLDAAQKIEELVEKTWKSYSAVIEDLILGNVSEMDSESQSNNEETEEVWEIG